MTKKDYIKIAKIVKDNEYGRNKNNMLLHKSNLIDDLCMMFKIDNSLFNKDRFKKACE